MFATTRALCIGAPIRGPSGPRHLLSSSSSSSSSTAVGNSSGRFDRASEPRFPAVSHQRSRATAIATFSSSTMNQKNSMRPTEILREKRERERLQKQRIFKENIRSKSSTETENDQTAKEEPVELVTKKPSDSRMVLDFPFSTDAALCDAYANMWKEIRIGRMLEELDSMAGEIAYRHTDGFNPKRPLTIVTASVDRIELLKPLSIYRDVRLDGNVTWVGTSSMEIRVEVQVESTTTPKNDNGIDGGQPKEGAASEKQWKRAMVATFTMVARDKENKSAPVNHLEPQTPLEKELYAAALEAKKFRKIAAMSSLSKQPPSEEEKLAIHSIFLKTKDLRDRIYDPQVHQKYFFMRDSVFQKSLIMHPQERNIHFKIFGGYLLREAFDLGWISVYNFAKERPSFLSLDDNHFLKPVEIGSILRLTSQVVFADTQICQVRVEAEVMNPTSGVLETTNIFFFTWAIPANHTREIVPETYEEAMFFLEGRRLYEKGKTLAATTTQRRFYYDEN